MEIINFLAVLVLFNAVIIPENTNVIKNNYYIIQPTGKIERVIDMDYFEVDKLVKSVHGIDVDLDAIDFYDTQK